MVKEDDRDRFYRLIAQLNGHFAADDMSPADAANWRECRRHILNMLDGLRLVEATLRVDRVRGIPLTTDTGRKLERYARFGIEGTSTEAPNASGAQTGAIATGWPRASLGT
jgi:hypothetical protein